MKTGLFDVIRFKGNGPGTPLSDAPARPLTPLGEGEMDRQIF